MSDQRPAPTNPPATARKLIPIKVVSAPPKAHSHEHAHEHSHDQDHHHDHGAECCVPDLSPPATSAPAPVDAARVRYRIDQMDCPTEERMIRDRLGRMAGVVRMDFNLLERELTVHHRLDDTGAVETALSELGMAPKVLEHGERPAPPPPALPMRTRWALALSGVAAAAAEAWAWTVNDESAWPVVALALLSLASAGLPTLKKGWIALRHLTLNIHFLMTLAVAGAMLIGQWAEAAMVVFLFALSEGIEALSLERARKAVQALAAQAPDTAWVQDGSTWQERPADSINVGQTIRVRAGERVPLDATVTSGQGTVDQSSITGESLPVEKPLGAPLYAGTVLMDGLLEATVTATAATSTMARMAQAVQQAQALRAPTQRFVDRFARVYTPAVVALALAVAVLGPVLTGAPWQTWLYQALVMLVIACPCALVVSTPVTVVSGLAAAARLGILVKGGVFLEEGRRLKAMALDKTGTLTQGRPVLTDVQGWASHAADEVLRLAASLDAGSTHPVARAVVAAWQARAGAATTPLLRVTQFASLPGVGVKARLMDEAGAASGHQSEVMLAGPSGLRDPRHAEVLAVLQARAAEGKTSFALLRDGEVLGWLAVADTVRPQSHEAVSQLQALGVTPVMLTGDHPEAAQHIARQVGIDQVRAQLMPADKLAAIEALTSAHGPVGMVGDGVNDAPALARAQIGFAMGAAGTATALETADVAIMDDDPRKLARFIHLSQRTHQQLVQNISLALGIKAVFMALALGGVATLWMAVFADVGASLLVVANGMRLLREARR